MTRVEIDRATAEWIIQQRYGPIIGIGSMEDADLKKRLPWSYTLTKPVDKPRTGS